MVRQIKRGGKNNNLCIVNINIYNISKYVFSNDLTNLPKITKLKYKKNYKIENHIKTIKIKTK